MNIVNGRLRGVAAADRAKTPAISKMLDTVIGEYNSSVADKRWKVLGRDRSTLKNLARCPPVVMEYLASHFHRHRAADAVITPELLCNSMYVPGGTRVQGPCPPIWQQILTVQESTCIDFFRRAIGDFERRLGNNASATRQQKQALRLTEQTAVDMLDSCLVWQFVQEQIASRIPAHKMQQLRGFFYKGCLASSLL
jgi:hypothetical protein